MSLSATGFTVVDCWDLSPLWSPEIIPGTSGGSPVMRTPLASDDVLTDDSRGIGRSRHQLDSHIE